MDRIKFLDALGIFSEKNHNLCIETLRPRLFTRNKYWGMRSDYITRLLPDTLFPVPKCFHVKLTAASLDKLKQGFARYGYDERTIMHLKVYSGEQGLVWFHDFCEVGEQRMICSQHVTDEEIAD